MEDLIKAIRSRLYRKGITGITNEEIRTAILEFSGEGEVTEEHKEAAYNQLFQKHFPAVKEDNLVNETFQEEEPNEEKPNFLALLDTAKTQNTESIVKQQSLNMGLTLNAEMIADIATVAKSQKDFNRDQFAAISFALKSFINYQTFQQQTGFSNMVSEVRQHTHNKAVELNNSMAGELSEFFREYQTGFESNVAELVGAINAYEH